MIMVIIVIILVDDRGHTRSSMWNPRRSVDIESNIVIVILIYRRLLLLLLSLLIIRITTSWLMMTAVDAVIGVV